MTYELFKTMVVAELKGHFPPDTSITLQSVPKNNCMGQDGLTILEEGYHIAPTIYLESYYQQMIAEDLSFAAVLGQILETYQTYRPSENIDTSFFQDFARIRSRIVFKLIHAQQNQALLEKIPHIPYLDLAIVFYCLLPSLPSKNATILIQNSHLKLWQAKSEDLYPLAQKNTPRLLPLRCEKLSHLLSAFLAPDKEKEQFSAPLPMYVLTNEQRLYGAACLLYEEFSACLSQTQSNFYVIPSSIHEVLLVPATKGMIPEAFNQMVQNVNETQLLPEEILSDHAYYYDAFKRKLCLKPEDAS